MTAPANDDFANAITLSQGHGSSSTIIMDDATREASEPTGPGEMFKSVWFTFVADHTGRAIFDTYDSRASDAPSGDGEAVGSFGHLDTQIACYRQTGSGFAGLTANGNDDDVAFDPSGSWSYLNVAVTGGATYYVQVGVFDPSYVGTIGFNWLIPSATAFNPTDISGLKVWLKADGYPGFNDGDSVTGWGDWSGGSHDFTEATHPPTYKTNIQNGLPVVRFGDGTSQQLTGGDLSALFSTQASVFVAAKYTNGSGKAIYYEHQSHDTWWAFSGAGYFGPFRTSRLANTPSSGITGSVWHQFSLTANSGNHYKVWMDGSNIIDDTSWTFQAGNSHIIGRQRTNNETPGCDIGEIIIYDSALSDGDRATVEAYLNGRWLALNGTATPSATAGTGAVPAATTTGTAVVAPSTTAGIGAVPAPTATGTSAGTVIPATVAGVGAVPAPTAKGNASTTPSTTAGVGAVPAPTATGTINATPAAVAGVGAVPQVRIDGYALPAAVAGIGRIPHPRGFGAGTGGGGGTTDGIYDFWSVKALG